MRKLRNIILTLHAPLELAVGTALLAIPFVAGFPPGGLIASVVLGALLVGLALAGTGTGRGTVPPTVHADLDLGMALGLLAAAVLLGFTGQGIGFVALLAGGLVELTLTVFTRYGAATA